MMSPCPACLSSAFVQAQRYCASTDSMVSYGARTARTRRSASHVGSRGDVIDVQPH